MKIFEQLKKYAYFKEHHHHLLHKTFLKSI